MEEGGLPSGVLEDTATEEDVVIGNGDFLVLPEELPVEFVQLVVRGLADYFP